MPIVSGVQHQMRRGTPAQFVTFKGSTGEVCLDTSIFRCVGMDGVLLGGYPQGLANTQTVIGSVATLIGNSVAVCLVYSTAAPGAVTLPMAASFASGQHLTVADAAGIAGTQNLVISANGSDGIITSTGGAVATVTIAVNGASLTFVSQGSTSWSMMSTE